MPKVEGCPSGQRSQAVNLVGDSPTEVRILLPPPFRSLSLKLIWQICFAGQIGAWRSLVSAWASGAQGRRFKSGRPDHFLGVSACFGNLIGDPGRIATYPVAATLF